MKKDDVAILTALTDKQLMGLCIEREAGGEPREGQIAVGTVILERVDHRNWDGKTIHEVILMPWQFSWTMPQAGEAYYEESVYIASHWDEQIIIDKSLQRCFDIASGMIDGTIPRDPDLAAVNCCQYLNPQVAQATKDQWLKKGMHLIKVIGKHQFFRE